MIFTSDEVTSENHCQITSRVTKESLFTVTNVLFYFLHAILCFEQTISLCTIIDRSFRRCRLGWSFLTQHCDVITVDLWRHANVRHWHCDVIFVDCSCTRKLAQRRSSLVNNNREYWFLTIRYSRLSMWEQAFSVAGPTLWSALPKNIRLCATLAAFKTKLKTYLFKKAYKVWLCTLLIYFTSDLFLLFTLIFYIYHFIVSAVAITSHNWMSYFNAVSQLYNSSIIYCLVCFICILCTALENIAVRRYINQ